MGIFENACNHLEDYLISSKKKYFIGGSVRFGYKNPNSDIDYFILIEDNVLKYFLENQFVKTNLDYRFSEHYRLSIGRKHIDIILLNEAEYLNLYNEHQEVENFLLILNNNQKLHNHNEFMKFITFLKSDLNIQGKDFYGSIRKYIAKNHKNLIRKES